MIQQIQDQKKQDEQKRQQEAIDERPEHNGSGRPTKKLPRGERAMECVGLTI
jgi:hypothetical protein